MKNLVSFIVVMVSFSMTSTAFAQAARVCAPATATPVTFDRLPTSSGYNHYSRLICSRYWIDRYWNDYGFVKNAWDGGFGWNDSCNFQRPLARMFSAMRYIDKASTWGGYFYDGIFGRETWHEEASGSIDTTNAECGNGQLNGMMDAFSNATFYFGAWFGPDGHTVGELASLIVHEARHEWFWHNGESCTSCDESWDFSPVMRDEIQFMAQMYEKQPLIGTSSVITTNPSDDQSYYLSFPQLELMRQKANWRLRNRFDTPPKFQVPERCGGWDINYPCDPPPCDSHDPNGGWNVTCP